jgi:hypothetical protein
MWCVHGRLVGSVVADMFDVCAGCQDDIVGILTDLKVQIDVQVKLLGQLFGCLSTV